jgi:hypothetical protein
MGSLKYLWDFGDGETGEGEFISHAYTNPGEPIITLMVIDEEGANNTYFTWITVESIFTQKAGNQATDSAWGNVWLYLPLLLIILIASVLVMRNRNRGHGELGIEDEEDDWDYDLEEEEHQDPDAYLGPADSLEDYRRSGGGGKNGTFSAAAMQLRQKQERELGIKPWEQPVEESLPEPEPEPQWEPQPRYQPDVPHVNWHLLYLVSNDVMRKQETPKFRGLQPREQPEEKNEEPDLWAMFLENQSRRIGDERVDREFEDRERFRPTGNQVTCMNPYGGGMGRTGACYYR